MNNICERARRRFICLFCISEIYAKKRWVGGWARHPRTRANIYTRPAPTLRSWHKLRSGCAAAHFSCAPPAVAPLLYILVYYTTLYTYNNNNIPFSRGGVGLYIHAVLAAAIHSVVKCFTRVFSECGKIFRSLFYFRFFFPPVGGVDTKYLLVRKT